MKHPLCTHWSAASAWLIAALSLILIGCTPRAPRITLDFDRQVDTLTYLYASLAEQTAANADQEAHSGEVVAGVDGSFTIQMPDDQQTYLIWIYRAGTPPVSSRHFLRLYLFPTERIHLDVTVDGSTGMMDYSITGSPTLEAEREHRKANYERLEMELESLGMAYGVIQNEATKKRVEAELIRLSDSIQGFKLGYIADHPDEPLSGYYVATLRNPYLIDSLYSHALGDTVKTGVLREMLDLSLKNARAAVATMATGQENN